MNIHTQNKINVNSGKNKSRISFLLVLLFFSIVVSGCIFNEVQEVKISGSLSYSMGSISEDQSDIQQVQWTVNVGNYGQVAAKNVSYNVVLHPEISSRLIGLEGDGIYIGNLEPDTWVDLEGNATFDASNLSKQDIFEWGNLIEVKVIWEENGEKFEKTMFDMTK